jgi:hypothetical protein
MNAPGSFTASYDRTTRILSGVVCLGLVAAAVAIQNIFVAGVSLLVILLSYAYSPRGYVLADGAITIRRLIGNIRVPLDSVREARLAGKDDFRGCVRLFGSGGLFGYYGLFRTSALGRSTWYMTDRSRAVILIAGAKTILVSPDDTGGFLSTLRAAAPVAIGATGSGAATFGSAQSRGPITVAILIGVGVGVAAPALVVAAMRYDPGPPRYTVTPTTLAIHDRFFPITLGSSSVDVSAVRVVNLAEESGWRPVLRVGGFANPHYQSGWYRAANGAKMRLYRAASDRLVLLPPAHESNPVLLEVDDPDRFVELLRSEWR